MKKNGQYVGVDEKYIPEDEKYVDNETNEEIKETINDRLRSAKNYVIDKDNQEKFKETGKKGLKILKGFGIGYLVVIGIIVVLVVSVFVFVIINMLKMNNRADDIFEEAGSIIDKVTDEVNSSINETINNNSEDKTDGQSKIEIATFNAPFELFSGSQTGLILKSLLNKVVTNNKTESEHIITVIYNETTTSLPDEITKLNEGFENNKKYTVSLDYDTNGFVNKITIK